MGNLLSPISQMSWSNCHIFEVEVVRAHEDADLEQVERVDVVVVGPVEAAQIDATQVPGEVQEMRTAASVSHPLAEPVLKSDLKMVLVEAERTIRTRSWCWRWRWRSSGRGSCRTTTGSASTWVSWIPKKFRIFSVFRAKLKTRSETSAFGRTPEKPV